MKVVQIAPFNGNTGDIFSYYGFQTQFKECVDSCVEFTNISIRDFYKNSRRRSFDKNLAEEINKHDALVVGGGYFDLRFSDSSTGTTLNMSRDFIDSIKIPVIINAIGYNEMYNLESNSVIVKNFYDFLVAIGEHKNWLVTVRNDGSYTRIKRRFGDRIASLIHEVPDNGFYFDRDIKNQNYLQNKNMIGIQIANDAFYGTNTSAVDLFNKNMGSMLQRLIDEGKRIVFFPHTPTRYGSNI